MIKGQTAWVTGASSGIGQAIALALLEKGLNVVASCRKEASLEAMLKAYPTQLKALCFDLAHTENDYTALSKQAFDAFNGLDFLFLNGGISQRVTAMDTAEEDERKLFQINYFAQTATAKACWVIAKAANKPLHIVPTGSIVSFFGFHLRSTYSATKHALKAYFESMYLEEAKNGLKITMVYPGKINTPIAYKALAENGQSYAKDDGTHENGVSAEQTAQKILKAIAKNKPRVYVGKKEMLTLLFNRISFTLLQKVLRKQV